MKEKKDKLISQSNILTDSRQKFNLVQKKCYYQVLSEVRRLYIDKNRKEGDILQHDLFDNMKLYLTPQQLDDIADNRNRDKVFKSLVSLRHKDVFIENDDFMLNCGYINLAKYDKKMDRYMVEVSSEIIPYLVELAGSFTTYSLNVALSLQSIYSQRFYELCSQYRKKGVFFLSIEDMRYMFNLENKYPNVADFRKRVIDVAQKELQELYEKGESDIYFTYREKEKQGKKVISYFFDLYTKETEEQKQIEFATAQNMLISIINLCKLNIKNDKKYIERIKKELNLHPDKIALVYDKLTSKLKKYSKADLPAIIRFVLREDFGIE